MISSRRTLEWGLVSATLAITACEGVSASAPPDASASSEAGLDAADATDGRDAGPDEACGTDVCTLSGGFWTCSCGGGAVPECSPAALLAAGSSTVSPCDEAGASCYDCYYGAAGLGCSCRPDPEGGLSWQCVPSGSACTGP